MTIPYALANALILVQDAEIHTAAYKAWLSGPLATFIIIRSSEYWLPNDFRKAIGGLNQEVGDTKKEAEQSSRKKKYSQHWQAANEKTSNQTKEKTKIPNHNEQPEKDELHLTLPIWTRLKEVTPYRHTDKEWQEFVKLQSDDARMEALFRNIAESTMAKFRRRPDSDRILQKIGYTNRINVSLEVLVPYRPPAVFEVPALRVTPGAIEWTWRTLPEHYGSKLHRITHPFVFFRAFWVGVQVFCKTSASNISTAFGTNFDKKSTSSMIEVLRGSPKTKRPTALKNASSDEDHDVSDQIKATQNVGNKSPMPVFPFDASKVLQSQKTLLSSVSSESAVKQATVAFQVTFMKLQLEALRELPRGACMIEGWIDYLGDYGMIRSQIRIAYLPSKDKFLGEPLVERINIFPHAPAISAKIEEQKVAFVKSGFSATARVAQHKSERDQVQAEAAQEADGHPAAQVANEPVPDDKSDGSKGMGSDSSHLPQGTKDKPMEQKLKDASHAQEPSQHKTNPGKERPP